MVFESLLSDVLNRFIGDYVENLDKSQLKVGIWGGDVVLENLRVKENTLSELDVPFKVKAGQIGKLTLKVPWKNLYSEAVVATLDGLYLLVVPEATIKYDAAKEERHHQESKRRELQRIEDALLLVARREKPLDEKKDTFGEKLFTQIIKNLQVKISSIHIRYEDDVSDPQRPLSVGVTLSELSLQTADENWRTCILNEAVKIIYKLGRLECLCVYWNVNSPIFYRDPWEKIVEKLKAGISSKDEELKGYQYIFKPIFASAKVCINPNADVELKSPKAKLHLEVQNIAIEFCKPQYLSVVELLESIDCMVKNAPYRKFRPDVPVHKHARQWWMYGINSVLEVHIRRFNQMWSWTHIRGHRQRLKAYKMAYKTKLTHGKLKEDPEKQILELEKVLDVFNITLARQQAQMEVVRSGQKLTDAKKAKQNHGGGGFFSGFFGKKERKKKDQEEEDKETESIDAVMTPEEKTKLYTAIGYSENSPNLALPKNYVAVIVNFKLLQTSVTVREEANVPEILKVQMIGLSTTISQRPGAQAIKVETSLEHWYVTGLQQHGVTPSLIASVRNEDSCLLSVLFELNPENTGVDQLLHVHSQPVELIYDALTINSLVEFFKTAKGVDLEVITSATLSKLEEIKEKTASGLSHIIETRKVLDLKIDLKPSYLLLPKSGFYHSKADLIIVDFGNLQLNSIYQSSPDQVSASFSSLEEIMDRAYERFSLELRNVQVLYSKSGEEWKSARMQGSSDQHILQPMDFTLELAKCMVEKDTRMPRFKVTGELPLLHVKISDVMILGVVELVDSIPLPCVSSTPPSSPTEKVRSLSLADTRPRVLSVDPSALPYPIISDSDEDSAERHGNEDAQRLVLEDLTDLYFTFEIKSVLLELTCQDARAGVVLALNVSQLGCEGKMRTYDLTVKSYLHKICLDYCGIRDAQNEPLHLITSSDKHGSDLLKIEYIKADVNGPSFQTIFGSTEQVLKVEFSSLDFLLHTKALLSTINYLSKAMPEFSASKERDVKRPVSRATTERTVSPGSKDSGVVSFKLFAMLGSFGVTICDDRSSIAEIQIQGIDASLVFQAKETEVFARLRNVFVIDVDTKTVHKEVVSIMGEEVFSFKLSLYPGATEGAGYSDTSKVDGKVTLRLGCIKILYLHKFLVSLLTFVDNFQEAKKAISIATAQAAEKAAASVKDFALKSFRLSMDIRLKAPLIIIPQSSTSHNAFMVDLGLITMSNTFSLTPAEGFPLPAVVETMDVKLTHLKLLRTVLRQEAPQPHMEILQPVNLELLVKRNLAASWFTKIPGVEVKGLLKSMNITIGCEDLCVLMRVLAENTEEGNRLTSSDTRQPTVEDKPETTGEIKETQSHPVMSSGTTSENVVNVLLKFEIMEVLLTLNKPKNGVECPFLVLHAAELGIDTKVHEFDMLATTYIKTISVKCPDIPDLHGDPVCILSSSAQQGAELLKVEYFKASRDGPHFSTIFENTEQKMNIMFSSLDLTLHTEALLSIMDLMSTVLSCSSLSSPEKDIKINEETKATRAKSMRSHYAGDIVDLKILVQLGAFNVLLCDPHCSIADMKIRDLHGSLLMKESETHMSARLLDFVVINGDPEAVHKKVVCIVDDEVFSFNMSLTPKATEGEGYTDTSKVDGKVKLNVGCVQVVYLQKFIMMLLKFSNSFQMAQEAVSVATAQAAEKAVSSVRDFAQKSFRISMDIRLKAPLIIIPQSSMSHNAVEVDLGLITVKNSFSLLPVENCPLPAVIDNMGLELTQLKLSRIVMEKDANQQSSEILQPVNLVLSVRRNLAATWYHKMAALEVDGDLKPMEVALSQDDLVLLLKILKENIGEASSNQPSIGSDMDIGIKQTNLPNKYFSHKVSEKVVETEPTESKAADDDLVETVKFRFNVDSLGLVLYSDDPTQPGVHQESLCIGEFMLHKITAFGKLLSDSSLEVSSVLTTCTLDDRRSGLERVTFRMLGKRDDSSDAMIDVTYLQNREECSVVAVFQKLYLCASMEFLMAVADFFIQALSKSQVTVSDKPRALPLKQISEQKGQGDLNAVVAAQRTKLHAVVIDPEVVFVANLMKADAPALVASFQCDFSLHSEGADQVMKANLKDLKILACPFIRNKESKAVTTVLRPCSVVLETRVLGSGSLTGSVTVDEVIVKISPIILNTVLTITAAMTPKPKEEALHHKPLELNTLWSVRDVYSCNFWFLDVETAAEVTEKFQDINSSKQVQSFRADVKVVQVTLESGLGHHTVPLLLAESSLSASARNWSSLLSVSADMTLEVNYFNETHAVWEPLIERVDSGKRRWNLGIEVKNNPVWDKSPVPGDDFVSLPESCTSINICSKDTMNITMSKCCLNVFQKLSQAFSEGAVSTFYHSLKEKAPFTIQNSLGVPLIIHHSGNLRLADPSSQSKEPEVGAGESVEYSIFKFASRAKLSTLQRQESCFFNLSIEPKGYSAISNIPVDKPGRRLYNVKNSQLQESVSVLLQISASEGNKVITVRSPLQIMNNFSVPFAILKYSSDLGGLVNVGVAEPEKEFHVTLDSYRCQLFLMPIGPLEGQYRESTTYIAWKEQVHVSSEVRGTLQCPAKDSSLRPVVINTLAVPDKLCHIESQSEEEWDPAYIIHLHPAVTLRNLLPYSIRFLMEGSADFEELPEGSTADLLNATVMGEIMELGLMKYQGRYWNTHVKITQDMPELFPVCFTSDTSENLTVDVYVHVNHTAGRLIMSIFSPYWIINKTARVLQYRAEDICVKHPSDFRDVILFSFKKKNIFSKNKLQLSVSTSSWSDGFSLDTVGSYGCVRCQDKTKDFLVEISIQLSSFNLTRIVTVSPFYTLVNKSSFELEVGEVQNDSNVINKWHYISSTECLPLWPESSTEKLCVRVVGSELASKSFFFNKQDNGTLLCMEQYGGIIVDVNSSDHSTVISFTDYYDGAAPALLVNHTPWVTITFRQSGCEASCELKPGGVQLFVWDNPAGVRKLCWTCQGHCGELNLVKDESGQFEYDDLAQVHWVSFLDGRQRILLFTEDVAVVTKACQAEELEQFQQEVNISIQNLGVSLINNDNRREIAYMGITSSGVVWEMKPKNRWKSFNNKNIGLLEKAYQNHISGKAEPGWVKLETGLEVDFTRMPMLMRHPYSCAIRRNFLAGIHVELKQSPHQRSLRAQLHWLQVDNQLTGAIFPIVFHPVPPPKSIVLDSEPKPFIDVSIITRFNEHSQVMQFKYFMVLVQEMALKMDQGFLGEILSFFTPTTNIQADKQKSKLIEKDLDSLQAQLMEISGTGTSGLSFFEHFHISPIKLHLSLSMGSSGDQSEEGNILALQSVNLLLKSIGATLTDVDDIIFKLAFFEIKYQFYRRENLMWAVIKHYTEQFLKQMYVLVLGLDVLGNPFGLIRGLSEGMEAFFYEPFQGAVQGPEEFAEGFVIGVRSFLGHTVGGAAGMVSRITGSVGKGLAAISMDKEYQQKRREEMNRPSKDFGSSLAKGGKGLLKGVVGGVTGIVTKPVEGVKKEGAAGFFKGIGKGLVGVVTRPTGGIVDMASSAFQGIQRAAESTEEVTKLRPVRLIQEDGIIRPYNQHESEGFDLFQRSEIKQLDGEFFREHYEYPGHRKTNIIITNRRVLSVKEIDLIGHFNKEWECQFEHFLMPPYVDGADVMIYYKEQNKLKIMMDSQAPVRVLHFKEADMANKLCSAIQNAQVARKQHQMVRKKSQRFINTSKTQAKP
ncbi:intermembrane lipid transfer protein VPS13C isoform X1 [Clarias gariepinus]|uniref:intermembrane lipid transfer protein VPS13C isoform X1 n=1 Tax=Clarias gariepinus TaxID=13013 RepID=UPI00234D3216|nr:intermembrane lipid transfer protein VPS13C isoform X1 [Clarias gariepinus]